MNDNDLLAAARLAQCFFSKVSASGDLQVVLEKKSLLQKFVTAAKGKLGLAKPETEKPNPTILFQGVPVPNDVAPSVHLLLGNVDRVAEIMQRQSTREISSVGALQARILQEMSGWEEPFLQDAIRVAEHFAARGACVKTHGNGRPVHNWDVEHASEHIPALKKHAPELARRVSQLALAA